MPPEPRKSENQDITQRSYQEWTTYITPTSDVRAFLVRAYLAYPKKFYNTVEGEGDGLKPWVQILISTR